jgi:hypothetical protein
METISSGSQCTNSITSERIKGAFSPIRMTNMFKKPRAGNQLHSVPRKAVNAMRALTESVRLSLPIDSSRQTLSENKELCSEFRTSGIGILVQLADAYDIGDKILAFAMALQDRCLAAQARDRGIESTQSSDIAADAETISTKHDVNIKHIAVTCFMLASKFVGSSLLWIDDILRVVGLHCSSAEIESCEGKVLKSIDWSLHLTTG